MEKTEAEVLVDKLDDAIRKFMRSGEWPDDIELLVESAWDEYDNVSKLYRKLIGALRVYDDLTKL